MKTQRKLYFFFKRITCSRARSFHQTSQVWQNCTTIPPIQFSVYYPISLRWLKSTLRITSYLGISEEGCLTGGTHTVGWKGTTVWLADRGQRETKLLLSKEVRGGLETKLKTVSQILLSLLRKLLSWQRLQTHTEPIQTHHPLFPIT